jgi:hypothetical protein
MKKVLVLLIALLPVLRGNACASAANGNWNSASSWSSCGSTFPGDGDTVTITHNITVTANATVGTSPSDTAASTPALFVIALTRTNGTTSNGQLTINGGVTFTVKGSVSTTGSGSYAPIITLQPGSTWTFDNSANVTAVYRIQSTTPQTYAYINAAGTAWTTGAYVTLNGRPPSCSTCTGAMWVNEGDAPMKGGKYSSFKHNYSYVQFWYFGSPTDAYRSMHLNCWDNDHQAGQQMYMVNVEWHYSTGFSSGGSSGYPCSYTDFKIQYMKTFDSTTAGNRGFFAFNPYGAPTAGKSRIAQYIYLDRGFDSNAGNGTLQGFQVVSYIVADGQQSTFGPNPTIPGTNVPNVDHILVRFTANSGGSFFYGSASYWLTVIDGGVGNAHTVVTRNLSSPYNWVIDHAIWQDGDTNSSDTDAYEMTAGTGQTASWNYMLMLPNAADPRFTSHTVNVVGSTSTIWSRYNHAVFTFGNNYGGPNGLMGSIYLGEEAGCGSPGAIGIRNSILWNPNPTAANSPIYAFITANCPLNSFVANHFDPAQIHHNLVWNYGTNSNRWTSAVTACGGSNCTSMGTPYDFPMTGTVPGASDVHTDPRFVWQMQHLTAPGPRDWARIKHGADTTTGETPTEVHFGTTFALFKNSVINDTSTTAGMKGLIDEMFAWLYGEWSSTNTALGGAGDDGTDIGAAPVTIFCPSAYPASVVSLCNSIAQTQPSHPVDSDAGPPAAELDAPLSGISFP